MKLDPWMRDLKLAARRWRKEPAFFAVAVFTLALGIGTSSAVFSLINAVLFRPFPVQAPEELVAIYSQQNESFLDHAPVSQTDFEEIRSAAQGETGNLADAFAYTYTPMAIEHGQDRRLVLGTRVTAGYFRGLGVEPAIGRLPRYGTEDEDRAGQEAVLSYSAWQRRYGGDPGVVGSMVRVNGAPYSIVGVAAKGFSGLTWGFAPELWSLLPEPDSATPADRHQRWLWVVARLQPEASAEAARAELVSLAKALEQRYPDSHRNRRFATLPLTGVRVLPGIDRGLTIASWVSFGLVGLVLLIACGNVSNLLLARGMARGRETSTRLALGAHWSDLARQLLIEGLLLAQTGAFLGLFIAWASNALLIRLRLPLPIDLDLGLAIDLRVLLFTWAIATAVSLMVSLAPLLQALQTDLLGTLRGGISGSGRSRRRWANGAVIAQTAFTAVLLICASLMLRSLHNAHRVELGFDPEQVVVVTLAPQLQGYDAERTERVLGELERRVREHPEAKAAGRVSHLPLTIETAFAKISRSDAGGTAADWPVVDTAFAGPGYFRAMGIPILRGRPFAELDTADRPAVAVVNQKLAENFWPGESAVGRRLRVAGTPGDVEVVGIVQDGKYRSLGEAPRPFLYRALAQAQKTDVNPAEPATPTVHTASQTLVVRARGDAQELIAPVADVLREVDAGLAVARLEPFEETLDLTLFLPRLGAWLFGLFGLLGLLLAATGLHSLVAYSVRERRGEIAVRLALGAGTGDITRLLLLSGRRLTAWGTVLGLLAGWSGARFLRSLLYGIEPTDPLTLVAVTGFLAVASTLVCYLPARRAGRIDPAESLGDV